MKNYFSKELLKTKQKNEDFNNSTKYWICDNDYVDNDVKLRDHVTEINQGSVHKNCNMILNLNQNVFGAFDNLKKHNSQLIIQETGKFNLKRNLYQVD